MRTVSRAVLLALVGSLPAIAQEAPADPVWEELQKLRERVQELEERVLNDEDPEDEDPEDEDPEGERSAMREVIDDVMGRLRISGYVLTGFDYAKRSDTSLRPFLREPHFLAGDLSIYLRAQLPFQFSVSGQILFNPRPQDNVYPLDEDFEIERLFVQWAPVSQFKIKLGKFITPVGYWVYLIHDEPLLPTMTVPLIVRNRIFDEEGVGAVLEGEQLLGPVRLGYAAWLASGQQSISTKFDDNGSQAFGGRVYLAGEDLGPVQFFQVGLSAYTSKVRAPRHYQPGDPRLERVAFEEQRAVDYFKTTFEDQGLTPWGEPVAGYRNRALAVDVVLDVWGLRLRTEFMVDWVKPRDRSVSHHRKWGFYAYLGYVITLPSFGDGEDPLELGDIEPYARFDRYDGNSDFGHELQSLNSLSVGLTYHINRYLQCRVEVTRYRYSDHTRDFTGAQAGLVGSF